MKNKLKILSALQWAWQRCAAVMLCMVLVFFGCKEDKNTQKMDEKSFVESLKLINNCSFERQTPADLDVNIYTLYENTSLKSTEDYNCGTSNFDSYVSKIERVGKDHIIAQNFLRELHFFC